MSKKIVFIGAGSVIFTRNLVRDVLSFPAFRDCTIALVDINENNLALAKKTVDKIIEAGNYPAKVEATTDRTEALKGADGVLCTIQVGGAKAAFSDVEIPINYGVNVTVGDTRGPSGIFRYLRTVPIIMEICKDIEKYCPEAIFLNYTNPMGMLCRTMQSESNVNVTGLCHSVQGTAEMLAEWIGAPMDEVTYLCAGLNHQAWYLEYKWNGKDAYPLIKEAVMKPEIYEKEKVRNEMFLHLGYYVTESSVHNAEYNPWFRKRSDLIEKYGSRGFGWEAGASALEWRRQFFQEDRREKRRQEEFNKWINGQIDLNRGKEYAAYIFNAVFGDNEMFEFNGNVRNFGLIDNLPEGCCVEIPVVASKAGLRTVHVGALPPQLAILNSINAQCEELAVEAHLTGDPRKVFHAVCYDPLTSAVLSLEEIRKMVDEMFQANKELLPQFKHFS